MSSTIPGKESTLEQLIAGLDQRGLLVFLILLGQQAMKILSEDKKTSSILMPMSNIERKII